MSQKLSQSLWQRTKYSRWSSSSRSMTKLSWLGSISLKEILKKRWWTLGNSKKEFCWQNGKPKTLLLKKKPKQRVRSLTSQKSSTAFVLKNKSSQPNMLTLIPKKLGSKLSWTSTKMGSEWNQCSILTWWNPFLKLRLCTNSHVKTCARIYKTSRSCVSSLTLRRSWWSLNTKVTWRTMLP